MSTRTDRPQVDSRVRYSLVLRLLCVVCGLVAIAWGAATFPIFRQQATIENTARRILGGETFRAETLVAQADEVEATESSWYCRPSVLRGAAQIRLRLAEISPRGAAASGIENWRVKFADSVRASLSCTPSDPFLWLVLYWGENNRTGFRSNYTDYLRMSYRLGPNEGWMMLKRNPLSLAVFEELPDDLAEKAIAEFAKIVSAVGAKKEAAAIFLGAGPRVRERILPVLTTVPTRHRQAFADALRAAGHSVTVPGIETRESRPRN